MWFKFKLQITWQAGNGGTKNVKITVAVKYLNNFWRTSEIPLVNCEISLQLKWSKDFFSVAGTAANQMPTFPITDTKHVYQIKVMYNCLNN